MHPKVILIIHIDLHRAFCIPFFYPDFYSSQAYEVLLPLFCLFPEKFHEGAQEWLRKLLTTQLKEIGNAESLAGVSAESNY